jgi:hypothetical protein
MMSDSVSKSTDALVETNVPAEITPPLFGKQDPTENRSHVPAAIRALLGKAPLLVTEDPNEYYAFLDALAREVRPGDTIEWLWVKEVADLTWEILRYRRIRTGYTNSQFKSAIGQRLLPGLERGDRAAAHRGSFTAKLAAHCEAPVVARDEANRLANNYLTDATTREEVDAELKAQGLDTDAIMAASFVEAIHKLATIDKMLESAELRRNLTLREIERRRALLGHALRQASDKVVDSDAPPALSLPAVSPLN